MVEASARDVFSVTPAVTSTSVKFEIPPAAVRADCLRNSSHHGNAVYMPRRVRDCANNLSFSELRTMSEAVGPQGALLPDGERLTPLGRWLRAVSFDELPQLWNVLCGEMRPDRSAPAVAALSALLHRRRTAPAYRATRHHGMGAEFTAAMIYPSPPASLWMSGTRNLTWQLDLRIFVMTMWRILTRHGVRVNPGFAPDLDVLRRKS